MEGFAFGLGPWIMMAIWWIVILGLLVWAALTFASIANSMRRIAAALERRDDHFGRRE